MHTMLPSTRMVLDDLKLTFMVGSNARSKSNIKLNLFPILAFDYCDIPEGRVVSGIQNLLFLRRPCVRCWSTTKGVLQQRCMSERTTVDICQAISKKDDLVSSSVCLANNIAIEKEVDNNETFERSSERNMIIRVAFHYGVLIAFGRGPINDCE